MFKITNKQIIGEGIKRIEVEAEAVASKARPGQFVMVTPSSADCGIPLSVVEADAQRGRITLVFQEVGLTTQRLGTLSIGSSIFSILGPLGVPSDIKEAEVVLCVGCGISIAQLLPICRALRKLRNKVIGIIGAKTKKVLILESQMRLACHKLYIATEDGSYEKKGSVVDLLSGVIKNEKPRLVYAVGPLTMLQAASSLTKENNIKTLITLNPVMVDGIGLCGSCRVRVHGEYVLACVDGPEFDGHSVDFNDLMNRVENN